MNVSKVQLHSIHELCGLGMDLSDSYHEDFNTTILHTSSVLSHHMRANDIDLECESEREFWRQEEGCQPGQSSTG